MTDQYCPPLVGGRDVHVAILNEVIWNANWAAKINAAHQREWGEETPLGSHSEQQRLLWLARRVPGKIVSDGHPSFFISAKEARLVCLLHGCRQRNSKRYWQIFMKFSVEVRNGLRNNRLQFGGNSDHPLAPVMFYWIISHYFTRDGTCFHISACSSSNNVQKLV